MRNPKYRSTTELSFGEVTIELKPSSNFQGNVQALNAMLVAGVTTLPSWVAEKTTDPNPQNGKDQPIKASIKDGSNQEIAELHITVPTTDSFTQHVFQLFIQGNVVPAMQEAARSYSTSRGSSPQPIEQPKAKSPLLEDILPNALQRANKADPKQLLTRR